MIGRLLIATFCVYLAVYIIAPDVALFWRATATVLICWGAWIIDLGEAS